MRSYQDMKIVYLIAGTFNAGGMERVMTQKANWLARHGYAVTVVTTDQRGRAPYFPLDTTIGTFDLGINYDVTNGALLHKLVAFPLKQWRHRRRLTSLLKRLRADVVVCMFNNDVSFAYKIADGSRKVLEIHFSKNKKLQYGRHGLWALADRWRTWREERLVRHYDRFVVLTQEDAALWGPMPGICVIPNARTFQPSGRADLTGHRVLAIGRYDYQKGFDRLIDIWAKVKGMTNDEVRMTNDEVRMTNDGWQLDIVGDGPLRGALQAQVARLGLQDSVHLLPPTSDVQSLYLRSSVLAMTSRYEGLPMVLIEAQACGLPIVAYACQCGPRDVIRDGIDGYLIEPGDSDGFARRLTTLMNDLPLRQALGQAAINHSESFTTERIMPLWETVFGHP